MTLPLVIVLQLICLVSSRCHYAHEQAGFRAYMLRHGSVGFDYETYRDGLSYGTRLAESPYPLILLKLVGEDMIHDIVSVDVHPSFDGDDVVERAVRFPSIRHLDLSGCRRTTDVAIEKLVSLPRLESLVLNNSRFSDTCVPDLCRLQSLQFLDISYSNITRPGLARLKARLPDCHIEHDHIRTDQR